MSDKQERYYVVSESELERLHSIGFAEGVMYCGNEGPDFDFERFEPDQGDDSNVRMAACRAREVIPTGFNLCWVEVGK